MIIIIVINNSGREFVGQCALKGRGRNAISVLRQSLPRLGPCPQEAPVVLLPNLLPASLVRLLVFQSLAQTL